MIIIWTRKINRTFIRDGVCRRRDGVVINRMLEFEKSQSDLKTFTSPIDFSQTPTFTPNLFIYF